MTRVAFVGLQRRVFLRIITLLNSPSHAYTEDVFAPPPTGVERRSSPKPKVERLPLPRTASIECSLHSFNGMADEVGRIQRRIQRDRDCRDLRRCSPSKVEGVKREAEVPSAWSQASSYSHLTLNS